MGIYFLWEILKVMGQNRKEKLNDMERGRSPSPLLAENQEIFTSRIWGVLRVKTSLTLMACAQGGLLELL